MTSAHLYHYHLDAAEEGTTYGVIAIAGSQSNAGNLFSGTFNASGKVASWERSMRSLRLPRYIGESNMCDYFSFSPGKPGLRDTIGQRGEALFYVILTKLYGRARPLFKPQFLGDKWPTVDFIVELIDYSIEVVPYFFVQVKTTQQGYTKRNRRLKIQVSASDARRLASFPAPTYVVGIDEVNEVAYITSVSGRPRHGLKSLSTQFPINEQTQNALYEEVEQFWRDFSQSGATSRFTDPRWR